MNGAHSLMLVIFSAFTINLTLQCALGLKGTSVQGNYGKTTLLIRLLIVFTAVFLLWFLFSVILNSIFTGTLIFILIFPLSYMVYSGLEYLVFNYLIKGNTLDESFLSFPEGITAVAVFICVNMADGFLDALLLSFGFTFGILLVTLIISEIRKRAELEAVPRFMRGAPLVLVTMGLLSLIFTAGSLIILRMFFTK